MVNVGDKVRKIPRRGHRESGSIGRVIEIIGTNARVASGEKQSVSTVWPIKQLRVILEYSNTHPCVCGGHIRISSGECDSCETPEVFGA